MTGDKRCATDGEIASYVAGGLADQRLATIEAHLDTCSACARVVVQTAGAVQSGRPPARPRIFDIGQVIAGRYRIAAFLGAGGMGEVYEAQDEELGEAIALKTVSAAATFDSRAVARLKAEVLLARKVTHRNVCRIFDFGVHADKETARAEQVMTPFLTMEILRGRTLADHVRSGGRFSFEEAASIARQMTAGLVAAHEAGIIHRDFKSDNVLLLPAGEGAPRAVITDFGLAGRVLAETERQAMSGSALYGTSQYLAPERVAGGPATQIADVYALGLVMSEMVTGSMASRSTAPLQGQGRTLPEASPLTPVILGCLQANPELRTQNAASVLAGLDAALSPPPPGTRSHVSAGRRRRLGVPLALAALASLVIVSVTTVIKQLQPAAPEARASALVAAHAAPSAAPPSAVTGAPAPSVATASPPAPSAWRRKPAVRSAGRRSANVVQAGVHVQTPPAPAPPAAAEADHANEPIRSLAPHGPRAADDDAPIDPFRR